MIGSELNPKLLLLRYAFHSYTYRIIYNYLLDIPIMRTAMIVVNGNKIKDTALSLLLLDLPNILTIIFRGNFLVNV